MINNMYSDVMPSVQIAVNGAVATASKDGLLTAGAVGIPVTFTFGSDWDGLNRIAVFKSGEVVKDRALTTEETTIPHEVMLPENLLYIGVEGRNLDGTTVIPTVWAEVGFIMSGANASGDPSIEPSPTVYDEIMRTVGDPTSLKTTSKESLVTAINELYERNGGVVDPIEIQSIVEEYLAEKINNGLTLVDQTTGNKYKVYVDDGKLTMAESEV